MTIKHTNDGAKHVFAVEGRLDTSTAPQLEAELGDLAGVEDLTFDFKDLAYISSVGLRVLLKCQKTMGREKPMVVTNVNETIMEVFDITGFSDILTIK